MGRKSFWQATGLFIAIIVLPYVFAQWNGGQHFVFGGFLLNPLDGNTYLAKMEEGRQGAWLFTLPYTVEKGSGAFLFLFYLLLGHLSQWTGLSLLLIFHLARVVGAVFLAYALYKYCDWAFAGSPKWARRAFWLALFGSGLGWLVIAFGIVTADLWVAEAFPFLSGLVNPHFSFGMGLLLFILLKMTQNVTGQSAAALAGMGLLLAVVMPFGVVVAGVVGGAWLVLEWLATRQLRWQGFLATFSLGGPALVYQYAAVLNDPLLRTWNAQNITPAPPVWDFLLAFSPALLLAIYAAWQTGRKKIAWTEALRLQIAWFTAGIVLIYFPFALQRRFMFAFFVPVSLLAVEGLRYWFTGANAKALRRGYALLMAAALLTNVVLLLLIGLAVAGNSTHLYLTRDESEAFAYIRTSTAADAVILCGAEFGNEIPAWTGRRVLYGHDFETVYAPVQKKLVNALLDDEYSPVEARALLDKNHVQYVLLGPDDRLTPLFLKTFTPVYKNDSVAIYRWQ